MKFLINFLYRAKITISEFFSERHLRNISFELTVRAFDIKQKRPVEITIKDFSHYMGKDDET